MHNYDEDEIFSTEFTPEEIQALEPNSRKSFLGVPRNIKSGVYKITNSLNDKIYVGSSKNLQKRLGGHIYALFRNEHSSIHFQNFFNKHKEIHFEMEMLEECHPSERFKREQFYLDTLQPFGDKGFNIDRYARSAIRKTSSLGKKRPNLSETLSLKFGKPLNQYSLDGTFIQHYKCPYLAQIATGIKKSSISNAAFRSRLGVTGGYIWKKDGEEFGQKNLTHSQLESFKRKKNNSSKSDKEKTIQSRNRGRKVGKYKLDGTLVKIYDSMREASLENNLPKDSIRACCRGKTKSGISAGFKWKWESEYCPTRRKVGKFSLNGELLEIFDGATMAQKTGLYSAISISKACTGKIKTYRGFLWEYLDD